MLAIGAVAGDWDWPVKGAFIVGIIVLALIGVLAYDLIRRPRRRAQSTPVEERIETWLFQYGYPYLGDDQPSAMFQMRTTGTNKGGVPFVIASPKDDLEFVVIGIVGELAEVEQAKREG